FGVPRFINSVERSKAAEAFAYLSAARAAQERYHAQNGTYADAISKLDIKVSPPKYFDNPSTIGAGSSSNLESSWSLTLTRQGPSAGKGAYTVTFTEQGYDKDNSTIQEHAEINPLGE